MGMCDVETSYKKSNRSPIKGTSSDSQWPHLELHVHYVAYLLNTSWILYFVCVILIYPLKHMAELKKCNEKRSETLYSESTAPQKDCDGHCDWRYLVRPVRILAKEFWQSFSKHMSSCRAIRFSLLGLKKIKLKEIIYFILKSPFISITSMLRW